MDPLLAGHLVRRVDLDSPFVELDRARAVGSVLGLISANRRGQIRRAIRDYQALGPLGVEMAGSLGEARAFLSALAADHQAHWIERGHAGAFAGRGFGEFHDALLVEGFARGAVQLCKVVAGTTVIGHSYNFVHQGRVLNYQNGFDYTLLGGRGTPGFVSHTLIAELNAGLGHLAYDFLAGDEAYKRRLGTATNPMTWLVVQKRRPKFLAEHGARRLRDAVVAARGRWARRSVPDPPTTGSSSR